MEVIKRDGSYEKVSFDKVLRRIENKSNDLNINAVEIAQKVVSRIFDGVNTSMLDDLTATICSSLIADNPDYDKLASRISISNHQKKTSPSFSETVEILYKNSFKLISDELYNVVQIHKDKLNNYINYDRDYNFDFFGFKTLERAYLLKDGNDKIVERPQHMFMRVALGIHGNDIKDALETYDAMSNKMFTHATPTLFNFGTPRPQGSSCFLLHMNEDSITGIYESLSECAHISKHAGGIGIHIHNVRGKNSVIKGTNGKSDGIIPMLRVFNSTARYVNQCFTPETIIYTINGMRKIKDVTTYDYVMTKEGKFKKVNQVICNEIDKEILEIKTKYSFEPVKVTKEHQIFISHSENEKGDNIMIEDYIPASDLKINDLTVYPFYKDDDSCWHHKFQTLLNDGDIYMEKSKFIEKYNVYKTKSYQTAHDIKYELLKHDLLCNITKENDEYIIDERLNYERYDYDGNLCDKGYDEIEYIKPIHYKGEVYDLNIEDNHNYLVGSLGIVHNSGKRNGSIAIYLEPWHCDIEGFVDMKKNHGNEEERARDLFYALWIPDLFMKRVKEDSNWSLMCPNECPGLSDIYGDEFEKLYEKYENDKKYRKQIKARDLWFKIMENQIETGTPYILYKDAVNRKSNQKNLGTIKSSNLCTEILEYTSPDEIAVCNLASICLPMYIEDGKFNFEKLGHNTKIVTKNLNKIIDKNYYPVDKAKVSNLKHRPIGIGVQGLTDVYMMLKLSYESEEAKKLNKYIFETIYYNAMTMSMEISKKRKLAPVDYDLHLTEYEKKLPEKYKGAYSSFIGSPLSQGKFQFDLWNVKPELYDWELLRQEILEHGVRNSLLLAPMPTASTAQIMGNTESFEIMTSNIYKRKTLAGEFIIVNKHLVKDLIKLNLWNNDMKENIIINEGSIQNIVNIPEDIKKLYKTAWEIKQKAYIDQAKDRGAFICQTQSMNIFLDEPTFNKLNAIHFYTWESGLKTGMYYLRTKPKASTQQFTINPNKSKNNYEICESCSA